MRGKEEKAGGDRLHTGGLRQGDEKSVVEFERAGLERSARA